MRTEKQIRAELAKAERFKARAFGTTADALSEVISTLEWALDENTSMDGMTPVQLLRDTNNRPMEIERVAGMFEAWAPDPEFWKAVLR